MTKKATLWYLNDKKASYASTIQKLDSKNFSLNSENFPNFELTKNIDGKEMKINNTTIKYTGYEYSIDNGIGERLKNQLIVFEQGKSVGFIIDKVSALSFLRSLLSYTQKDKSVIASQNLDSSFVDGNMFFWIISKIYNDDSNFSYTTDENQENILSLDSLDGIKGKTAAHLNSVSTQGSDVINMLTTMAFLLESNRLTEVRIVTTYRNHDNFTLEIRSHKKNISVGIEIGEYQGIFSNENCSEVELRAKLLLLAYLDFLPTLLSLYKDNTDSEDNVKRDLVKNIIEDISKRTRMLKQDFDIEDESEEKINK